ncbi:hypothetical protein MKK70_14830, partial [Methylobacterium sp. E-041]|uniref:hypothetical protein n=1 Tax=Methylobacterium sp. E-041 TaxID=2836573 RepID=UPI001FB91365
GRFLAAAPGWCHGGKPQARSDRSSVTIAVDQLHFRASLKRFLLNLAVREILIIVGFLQRLKLSYFLARHVIVLVIKAKRAGETYAYRFANFCRDDCSCFAYLGTGNSKAVRYGPTEKICR